MGVAALGSLFNGRLISFLTQRLIELGVPPAFRSVVLNAVVTGQVTERRARAPRPGARRRMDPSWPRSLHAAYDALHSGLTISLFVAAGVILASGLVAWFTFLPEKLPLE